MENKFNEWFDANEKRFAHAQFSDRDIAYSAWMEEKGVNNNSTFKDGFKIDFIPSYTIQKGNPKLFIHPDDMPSDEIFVKQNLKHEKEKKKT